VLTQAIDHTVLTKSPKTLIVDMADVDFLGSAGMSALFSAHDQLETIAPLTVVADGPATSRILKMAGLDSILRIHSTLDAALSDLGHDPDQMA
jgi:anti-sigma B factor antagonist